MGGMKTGKGRLATTVACFLMLFFVLPAWASGITIRQAEARLEQGVYHLDADINYEFSEEVLEALSNGVTLTLQTHIHIQQARDYAWDKTITNLLQRYQLRYHALSGLYIVKDLNDDEQKSFLTLASALRAIGHLRGLQLLDASLLNKDKRYQVRLQAELDTNALPAPLRPVAWLSGNWQLSSTWYVCPL